MADLAFDPNQQDNSNTSTNILSNQNSGTSQQEESQNNQDQTYISTGNPYGKYAAPQSGNVQLNQPSTQNTIKKTTSSTPSSGQHTNVQSYIAKNQAGSQKLGQTVSGKLQTSADLARQNLQANEKSFQQGMDTGSLENWQGAVNEAKGAYEQAANQKAPERQFYENQARMYTPGTSAKDKALIQSNTARAVFGDGTSKDFKTQSEAQQSIDDWNKQNSGYYTYGKQNQLSVSDDRLADILNAKYAGPTDLHQVAGYSDAYNQFNKTQKLQDLAKSTGFKGTLLKETFENPNMTYSLGNQLLDDLLLGQGYAAQTLKQTSDTLGASPSGKMTDELNRRVLEARGLASGRSSNIDQVKKEARSALDEVALGREGEVEGRLGEIVQNWKKYPQYYRDIFTDELNKHNAAKGVYDKFTKTKAELDSTRDQLNFINEYDKSQNIKSSLNDRFSSGAPRQVYNDYVNLSSEKGQLEAELAHNGKYGRYLTDALAGVNVSLDPKGYQEALSAQKRLAEVKSELNSITNNKGYADSSMLDLQRQQYESNEKYKQYKQLTQQESDYVKQVKDLNKKYGVDFNKFDPNSMNVGLSQLEAEMLGIKGGEGLYNLLSQPGGIDNLIKTAKADKNKLISQDEQSQLSRLQSIAQLAEDYGSQDSGIDFRNEYLNRDLAGNQTALDAIDMNNLRSKLQGSEKEFRDFADAKTVTGKGTGKGSSGGMFGKKTKKVTKYINANVGDILDKSDGWRNMYSTKGVNEKNVDDILGLAQKMSKADGDYIERQGSTGVPQLSRAGSSYVGDNSILGKGALLTGSMTGDPGAGIEAMGGMTSDVANIYKNIVGDIPLLKQHAGALGEIGNVVSKVGSGVSSGMFGNSAKASAKAERNAYNGAVADLQTKLVDTLNKAGYGNQLTTQKNTQRDTELLKLLGLLDLTNR